MCNVSGISDCQLSDSPLDSLLWGLALELTGLPLLELGGSLAGCGGATSDAGGGQLAWVQIHGEGIFSGLEMGVVKRCLCAMLSQPN